MPNFAYRGRNSAGQPVEGMLEAVNANLAADALLGAGVTPLFIEENAARSSLDIQLFKPRIGHIDILLFTRQIYTLLKSGVLIMQSLVTLLDSSANPAMQNMLRSLRESLDQGRVFSDSLARHPKVFTPFCLSMVHVGERTGQLEAIYLRLFDHLAFE